MADPRLAQGTPFVGLSALGVLLLKEQDAFLSLLLDDLLEASELESRMWAQNCGGTFLVASIYQDKKYTNICI